MRTITSILLSLLFVVAGPMAEAQPPEAEPDDNGDPLLVEGEADLSADPEEAVQPLPPPVANPETDPSPMSVDPAAAIEEQEEQEPEEDEDERDYDLTPGLVLFTGYRLSLSNEAGDTDWFHQFEVERAHVHLTGRWRSLSARIKLEGVYSTSGAVLGDPGDGFLVRIREAWIGYDILGWVELHAGLVRTLTQPAIIGADGLRVLRAAALRRFRLLAPADSGATVTLFLPANFGELGVGAYNGEGYESRENNRGKNTEFFARIRPLALVEDADSFHVVLAYSLGSLGVDDVRSDRFVTSLLWDDDWLGGGVTFAYLFGLLDESSRQGWTLSAFARAELFERLLLGARYEHFARNVDETRDALDTLLFGVGARIEDPLDVWLSLERNIPSSVLRAAEPSSDNWQLRVIAHLHI